MTLNALTRAEYFGRYETMKIRQGWRERINAIADRIEANRERYERVAIRLPNPPWFVIALIHQLEADGSWNTHLHNGDPLKARTVNVPRGRPLSSPPFTWEDSAWDAVRYDGLHRQSEWTIAGILYALEKFNGFGYRDPNVNIPTPYLWSGTHHYTSGKYVRDGDYDPAAVSKQVGAAPILNTLCTRGIVSLKAIPV